MASGQDQSIVRQLDDITDCSICSKQFTDPRSLPCIHSFCLSCIQNLIQDKQPGAAMSCPVCTKKFIIPDGGVDELPKNYFILKLIQIKESISGSTPSVCNFCQPDTTLGVARKNAEVYCVECREKYCEDCDRCHRTFKSTRSHKRLKLDHCGELFHQEEVLCKSSPTFCEKHQDQGLNIYCLDCKSVLCVICYIAAHKQHNCSDINDVIQKFRDGMTTDMSSLANVARKLQKMFTSVEQQKENLTKTVGKAEIEICKTARKNLQLIKRNKRTLLKKLTRNQESVVKKMDILSRNIIRHLAQVENLKKYTGELSRKGTEADIARETSVLHNRVEELLNVDVLEQSRDQMHSTDIKFTSSTLLTENCKNAIGKIKVLILAKVKKEKPIVVMKTDNVSSTVRENVQFESTVTGELEPTIEWFKDGVKIAPSSRTMMKKNGNVCTLVMNNVVEQDEGQYTVRATNSEGTTEAVATLTVKVLEPAPTVPTLTHIIGLPSGSSCFGSVGDVTSLNNQLFVVRCIAQQMIEVYDATTFALQQNIYVPGLNMTYGLASCAANNCLYITEYKTDLVYRVGLVLRDGTKWSVDQRPRGISTNSANNVLVACYHGRKIQEYTSLGCLIRDISLSPFDGYPFNVIELPHGRLAITNGNGVCVVDVNAVRVRDHSHRPGASVQFYCPRGFALARSGCTLVADRGANRLVLFNPSFTYSRVLSLPNDSALNNPSSLFLDESRGRLYVGEWGGCRVLVFDNVFNVGTDFL